MGRKEVLVIIPAFNESACIGQFLDKIAAAGTLDYADVLVTDDGSSDGTRAAAAEHGAEVMSFPYNLGYGCALQAGYKYAVRKGYEYIVQIDADGQHDAKNIENIAAVLRNTGADLVIGSRFMLGSRSFPMSGAKKLAIKLFRFLIRVLTGQILLDPTSGLQGISRRLFTRYSVYDNFDVQYPDAQIRIRSMLENYKVLEIPAVMHPRVTGESMHSGIIKPILYVMKMSLNIFTVAVNGKLRKTVQSVD